MNKASELNKSVQVVYVENLVNTEQDKQLFELLKSWDLEDVFVQLKGFNIIISVRVLSFAYF